MKTITFYSYKGGVGRSLLVANAARYLSILGKNVFAIDLDLEAPGLHYKFELDPPESPKTPNGGLIDILIEYLSQRSLPDNLASYVAQLDTAVNAGRIHLMWSGEAPLGQYWRKLAKVNWHELLYGSAQGGTRFFLDLKKAIEKQYQPDFLLIDARTGVTEMGGIATTLLPDVVVALMLPTREHLEGIRAVMHGILHSSTSHADAVPIQIIPVLSRLPLSVDPSTDNEIVLRTSSFLNDPFGKNNERLSVSDIAILHAEPSLDGAERLLVGGKRGPHEIRLLRDYLRLFSTIIPAEDVRPHVGSLIQNAISRILDDPEGAQSSLEELTTYCGDPVAYRALLKLYRVTKAPLDKVMTAATTMWHLGADPGDPLLAEIVKLGFSEARAVDLQKKHVELGEAVWRASGGKDARIALTLAALYIPERRDRALRVLREYVERVDPPHPAVLAKLIDLLRPTTSFRSEALDLVARFKATVATSPEFLAAWARLIVDLKDPSAAQKLINDPLFRKEALKGDDLLVYYRLCRLAGYPTGNSLLFEIVDQMIADGTLGHLRELAEISEEEGRLDEFVSYAQGRLPAQIIEELLERRRTRFLRGRSKF
jgi:hypothetical protein